MISSREPTKLATFCSLVLVVAGTMTSCTDATPSDENCPAPGPEGVAVDDYCDEFAHILCEGYGGCCEIADIEACISRIFDECEAGEISSIRAGASCLDPAIARRCLDSWRSSFDDCQRNETIGADCRYQWYGHAALGETCRDVWWCERGLGCVMNGTTGTCVELPNVNEDCGITATCSPGGLYCSHEDWTCHPEPTLGEPCEREESENICAAGACIDGTCQAYPWCG